MSQSKKVKKPIQTDDFYNLLTIESPHIHPNKKLAVYVQVSPEHEGQKYSRNLWTIDLKTKKKKVITSGIKGGDYMPKWSPDGNTLAFISSRNGRPQIYILKNSWGEASQLTSVKNGVLSFVWSPDGSQIAFFARTREEERQLEDNPPKRRKSLSKIEAKRLEEDRECDEKDRIDPRIYDRTVFRQGTVFKIGRAHV